MRLRSPASVAASPSRHRPRDRCGPQPSSLGSASTSGIPSSCIASERSPSSNSSGGTPVCSSICLAWAADIFFVPIATMPAARTRRRRATLRLRRSARLNLGIGNLLHIAPKGQDRRRLAPVPPQLRDLLVEAPANTVDCSTRDPSASRTRRARASRSTETRHRGLIRRRDRHARARHPQTRLPPRATARSPRRASGRPRSRGRREADESLPGFAYNRD